MKKRQRILIKPVVTAIAALVLIFGTSKSVSADEAADAAAQAQLALLMQTPEYQAALALQQQQLAQIAAQQQALLQQQAAVLAAQQAAAQAAWNAQLAAAQQVYANAQYLHEHAINQAYLLNATQYLQRVQYEGMINKEGLDYKGMLMKEFNEAQYNALRAFMGYNGL